MNQFRFMASVRPSPIGTRLRSIRLSWCNLSLSALMELVSTSLIATSDTAPPHSTLSIVMRPRDESVSNKVHNNGRN